MALSTVVKNFTDGSIQLKDGTGTPITVTVQFSDGDFSASGFQEQMNEVVAYETRGVLNSVRHTVRKYITFSFTAQMSQFTNATAYLSDAVLKNGAFSAAVSTLGTTADVYTLDVVFTVEGTNFGDSADHTFTLEDCHLSLDFAEGDPNKFTINGTCYGAVVGDLAM